MLLYSWVFLIIIKYNIYIYIYVCVCPIADLKKNYKIYNIF